MLHSSSVVQTTENSTSHLSCFDIAGNINLGYVLVFSNTKYRCYKTILSILNEAFSA